MKNCEVNSIHEDGISWLSASWKPLDDADLRSGESVVYLGVFEGAVKIGISINPEARLKTLTTASGRRLDKAYVLFCNQPYDAFSAEKALHKKYSQYRGEGEWFKVNPSDLLGGDMLVRKLPFAKDKTSKGLSKKQAQMAYDFFMVATPGDVYNAQINAVKRAFVPIMAEVMACLAATVDHAGRPFVIETGLSSAEAMLALGDLVEDGGGLRHFDGLEDVVDRIAAESSFGSRDEFVSMRDNGGAA